MTSTYVHATDEQLQALMTRLRARNPGRRVQASRFNPKHPAVLAFERKVVRPEFYQVLGIPRKDRRRALKKFTKHVGWYAGFLLREDILHTPDEREVVPALRTFALRKCEKAYKALMERLRND